MADATSPSQEVELSILAAPADLRFFEPTARHLLRSMTTSAITRTVLCLDLGERDGRLSDDASELVSVCSRLIDEGLADAWTPVDWALDAVRATMLKWYGDAATPVRVGRRAIYQYVFSVESAQRPYVVHLDSDVLHRSASSRWVDQGLELFATRDDVAAVIPMSGVPQATRSVEWLLGRRADRPLFAMGWNAGTDFTSRHFLIDRRTVEAQLLPLPVIEPPVNWEVAMSAAIERAGLKTWTYVNEDEYFLHPHRHNDAHARYLSELIEMVEAGRYPYRRWGRSWDITTEGRQFTPWLLSIGLQRLRRRSRSTGRGA